MTRSPIAAAAASFAAAGLALALAGCAPSSETPAPADDAKSIIIVVPTSVSEDNFIALAASGAEQAAEATGATVKVFEGNNDPQLIQQHIDAAVREAPDVIIGATYSVQEALEAAAADNPDQEFLLVDQVASVELPNLTSVAFKEYEAAYLIGVEAALLSETGHIGVVGAVDSPFIHRWIDPLFEGAVATDPAIQTSAQYVGGDNPFTDVVRSKAQAQILIDQGVDIIQAASSGGNGGTFEAAAENGILAFGVSTNQCPEAPGVIIDNNVKYLDVAIVSAVEEIFAGNGGGIQTYGLAEGGVGVTGLQDDVADSECLIADYPEILEKVAEVRDQIIAGDIVIVDPLTAG